MSPLFIVRFSPESRIKSTSPSRTVPKSRLIVRCIGDNAPGGMSTTLKTVPDGMVIPGRFWV